MAVINIADDVEVTLVVPPKMVSEIIDSHGTDLSIDQLREQAMNRMELGHKAFMTSAVFANQTVIEEAFEDGTGNMTEVLDQKRSEIVTDAEKVIMTINDLLGEKIDEDLVSHLENGKDVLTQVLLLAGDPNISGSLAQNIQLGVTASVNETVSEISKALNLASPDSMSSNLLKTLIAEITPIVQLMDEMKTEVDLTLEKLALVQGFSEKKTTDQGDNFEEAVGRALSKMAESYGDNYEEIGLVADDSSTSKKGDHLIEVILGEHKIGNIVFESKSGSDWTLAGATDKSIQKELETSISINKAQYGVAVVDATHEKQYKEIKDWLIVNPQPSMYVVGVDVTTDDFSVLRLVYRWARLQMVAEHYANQDEESIDVNTILTSIGKIKFALNTLKKHDTNFGQVIKSLEGLRKSSKQLHVDLDQELATVEALLGGGEE